MTPIVHTAHDWRGIIFRLVVCCALILICLFYCIRLAEDTDSAYLNGYWHILRSWEVVARWLILGFGSVLLTWSAYFAAAGSGARRCAYAAAGIVAGLACVGVYLLGLNAVPR